MRNIFSYTRYTEQIFYTYSLIDITVDTIDFNTKKSV